MSNYLGHYSIILGFFISIILLFQSGIYLNKKNKDFSKIIFSTLGLQFFLVLLSFLSLVYSFLISDFSNETVYNNSNLTKPLFYKISGTWGNHEGSLLLWLMVLTFFAFIFFYRFKKIQF